MNKFVPFLFVLGILLVPVGALFLYYPIHDVIGRWNTVYSAPSTVEKYARVTVGLPRAKVVDLLGAPLQTSVLTNYPVWTLRDEGVRRHYGTTAKLQIETLSFSRARLGGDYDMVSIWIGPDTNVIQHDRWVTD